MGHPFRPNPGHTISGGGECIDCAYPEGNPVHLSSEESWVNSDIKEMGMSIIAQADTVRDEEPLAPIRRAHLLRAGSFMLNAYAELQALDHVTTR